MATCKDCLHVDVCDTLEKNNGLAKCDADFCGCFKPAADVQEVRHERWKKDWCDNNLIGHEYEECTGCGCSMIDTNQFWDSHYCPLCGAIMDGKGDA